MPRIVAISDTHNNYPKLPDGDILIHCGDLTARGSFEELFKAVGWLLGQPHKHKVLVPGNHDFGLAKKHIPVALNGINFLVDQEVTLEGLKIYGSPWTVKFQDWAFMAPESELCTHFAKIPEGLDILVTHGPAWGILDRNFEGTHCGSISLYDVIFKVKPKYHIFGHIHEGYGRADSLGWGITHINCAWVGFDGKPKPPNPPVVLDL